MEQKKNNADHTDNGDHVDWFHIVMRHFCTTQHSSEAISLSPGGVCTKKVLSLTALVALTLCRGPVPVRR